MVAPMAEKIKLLNGKIKDQFLLVIKPLEVILIKMGILPNTMTLVGLIINAIAGLLYCKKYLLFAGLAVLLGGLFDILDGAIARDNNKSSKDGSFLDSTMDRYSEILIFLGLILYYQGSLMFFLPLLALLGSLMVSYVKARAEGLGIQCPVGLMQRPERIVFLGLGTIMASLLANLLWFHIPYSKDYILAIVILVIAVFSNYTAIQRIVYIRTHLRY